MMEINNLTYQFVWFYLHEISLVLNHICFNFYFIAYPFQLKKSIGIFK